MRIFTECYTNSPAILTEGAIGRRLEREFGIVPDKDVFYAGLIYDERARCALETLYAQYLSVALAHALPIILLTNTRRASKERMERSVFNGKDIIGDYTRFLRGVIKDSPCEAFIGGMLGCKNDAYAGDQGLSEHEAVRFHSQQVEAFMRDPPDVLYAAIMPTLPEAAGIARVMGASGLPYIISFMIDRCGTLLDGASIHDAIAHIDGRTLQKPLCYMSNCVHPNVLLSALAQPINNTPLVRRRFHGLQANAADMGAAALDGSVVTHTSPAGEWADRFMALSAAFPLKVFGGCCGTDNTHIEALARYLNNR